ncbi:MAG TPA: winged helix-turn-helix transcriptional regulator [Acidobacteriota bacterium]|nr:winged helix-turn-helix transcriptional regulator [Acidobacteriota bacterium]
MRAKALQSLYLPAPKLNQLHILKQIAADPEITQAELAQRCALSVAMVNNYMKELCTSGLLEYRRKSSKSISYHLTVAGMESADATERELLQEDVRFFIDAKKRIREMILSQCNGNLRRAVLYGSGDLAELVFHALESADVSIVGICDDNPGKVGRECLGRSMMSPSQIQFVAPDSIINSTVERADETYQSLISFQGRGIRVIRLCSRGDLPESAVCPPAPEGLPLTPTKKGSLVLE